MDTSLYRTLPKVYTIERFHCNSFHSPECIHVCLLAVGVEVSVLLHSGAGRQHLHDLRGEVIELGAWDDATAYFTARACRISGLSGKETKCTF